MVGPHRYDLIVRVKGEGQKRRRNLARFGSRGEQRMGVLWLKLAELSFVEKESGEKPTLLLDDIFSELDREHRNMVMDVVGGRQTIITTANPHFIKKTGQIEKIQLNG